MNKLITLKTAAVVSLLSLVIGGILVFSFYKPQPEVITKIEYREKIVKVEVEKKNVTKKTTKETLPNGTIKETSEEIDLSAKYSQEETDKMLKQSQVISPKKNRGVDLLYLPSSNGAGIMVDFRIFSTDLFLKGGVLVPTFPPRGVDGVIGLRYEY